MVAVKEGASAAKNFSFLYTLLSFETFLIACCAMSSSSLQSTLVVLSFYACSSLFSIMHCRTISKLERSLGQIKTAPDHLKLENQPTSFPGSLLFTSQGREEERPWERGRKISLFKFTLASNVTVKSASPRKPMHWLGG